MLLCNIPYFFHSITKGSVAKGKEILQGCKSFQKEISHGGGGTHKQGQGRLS